MTKALKDFRGKVTAETWCVIEAESRTSGRDHAEIVRAVLHEWAAQRIETARVTHALLDVEGIVGKERE